MTGSESPRVSVQLFDKVPKPMQIIASETYEPIIWGRGCEPASPDLVRLLCLITSFPLAGLCA